MALIVESGLLSVLLSVNCGCDDGWQKGVQDCRSGVERVVKKFPKPTYDFGQSILALFNAHVDNLQALTNNTSPTLSSKSTKLLEALSILANVGSTPTNLLNQVDRTLSAKTSAYRSIVSSLNETIGDLDKPVTDVVTGVQDAIANTLKQFNKRFSVRKQDRSEKIDFMNMVRASRLNMFTISFITEAALENGDKLAPESFAAIAILTFISNLQILATHGVNANIGSVLVSETDNVSPTLRLCFEALDPLVLQITKLISSSSFQSLDTNKEYLANFVKIIHSYEKPLANLLGPLKGVGITKAMVIKNLAKKQSEGTNNAEGANDSTNEEGAVTSTVTNTNAENAGADNAESEGATTNVEGDGGNTNGDPTTSQSEGVENSAN